MLLLGVVCAGLLGGCMLSPNYRTERFRSACLDYGFQAGTPEFAYCMQSESHAWQANFQQSMQNLQNVNKQRSYTTTCTQLGSFVNCTTQ